MSRRTKLLTLGLLTLCSQVAHAAPMPYDSIGNPLNNASSLDREVQRKGDLLNLVPNRVRVNQAGYRQRDVVLGLAQFYYVGTALTYSVVNDARVPVANGTLSPKGAVTVSGQINPTASNSAEHQTGGNGDWKTGYPMTGTTVSGTLMAGILPATLPAGRYRILVGADSSVPFIVSDNVYAMARDAALKFFGVARSGDYESWFHPNSHMWDGWLFDTTARNPDGSFTYKGALKGGWYDCGNHLKEARTISYPLATLGMLAATMPEKDADNYALNQGVARPQPTDGIPDVLREAWVGSQFVFNSWRLAKGKAADMILSVGDPGPDFGWWGRPENQDAVLSPRRGGRSERVLLKNWGSGSMGDFAAGLAFTSRRYRVFSPSFADSALTIAKAMYEVAKTSNRKETAPDYAGDAVLYDDLALAAVALLWATGDTKYLKEIAYTAGMPNGSGAVCAPSGFGQGFETTRFQGGFFGCGSDGMKKNGGPTDYGSVNTLALYSFAKLILVNADTAKNYGITAAQRDTLLLRTINQTPGPTWGQLGSAFFTIPVGGQYDQPIRLAYDSIWYAMGQGYGKTGWWNKYQFGNLADLYMYYDMSSLVDGRAILDKPGNTDWKRKEVLRVLLGGLNYMFGTNALDISYLYGIGRKNPMHPHHRSSNPEGKNVPGAYYYYQIPVGGLYGGLMTGPTNSEVLREYFDTPVGQTEANCPDAQAAVMIPLMGLASEAPVGPPMPTVKVLDVTDTSALIQIDLDKWGFVKLGLGLDSALAAQTRIVPGGDTNMVVRIHIGGLKPATQYYFHVVSSDLGGLSSLVSKRPNGLGDSISLGFVTDALPAIPPLYGNIKVCNVTSDSAEVLWATPNGEYRSSVMWADSISWKANKFNVTDSDAVGNVPVRFHRVKLQGLKPKTTYYYKVGTPGSYDATVGCFRTPNEDVKFDIRTTHYTWGGKPAMGISVLNQNEKLFDSLQIRLYVNGTQAEILDLAARVDIAFKYRSDAFIDSGLFAYTKNVSKSRPKLIDPACPAATQSCAWYFDLPMYGATMDPLARWRLDVVFDRHLLERDSTEILDKPPTHDPFAVGGQDWSMRPHLAGSDNGLSPVAYPGVPAMGKEDIDKLTQDIPVNPYIAVYRRNEFVYGFSPSAVEQKTKRTVFAMDATFDKPFDLPFGNTIEIGTGTSTTLKGTLNPYDVMIPQSKGYINTIWVNGTALTNAERRAALTRQADGTWKVALPLRFVTGTNKVDVTFFASADSTDTLDAAGCSEGKGCAFYNAFWYVNYVSNLTASLMQVVDASDKALGLVTPDSSRLIVRVKDGNANLVKTAPDQVAVVASNRRTGAGIPLVLTETGVNTGVFQTAYLAVVSAAAVAGQLQMMPGDTLDLRYQDASDAADTSAARVWATAAWPSLVSGAVVAGCGSNHVSAKLDKPLGAGGARDSILGGTLVLTDAFGAPVQQSLLTPADITVLGSGVDLLVQPIIPTVAGVTGGSLELQIRTKAGKLTTTNVMLTDSVGPWIDSAKIVENIDGRATDTLYAWTSEPTVFAKKTLPEIITGAGLPVSGAAVEVNSAWLSDPAAGRWTILLRSGAVRAGDLVRWNPAAATDANGIAALDCPAMAREIKLISRPAPFSRAWILDADGDSRADQVRMVFRKILVPRDLPDSVEVMFGLGAERRSVAVSMADAADSNLVIRIPGFAFGSTIGAGSDGSGTLMLWKSGTANGPYPLSDSVGPAVVSAGLVYGALVDTLDLSFSEPVRKGAGVGWITGWPGQEWGTLYLPDSVKPARWRLPVAQGSVYPDDSLRLGPTSRWTEAHASKAGANHPWIVVTGGERGPMGGWYKDVDGDGRVDQATVVFALAPRTRPAFSLWWPDGAGGLDSSAVASGAWSPLADGKTVTIPVGPFAKGVTVSASTTLGKWSSGGESWFGMQDSVPPALVSAVVRYGSVEGVPDTLRVRWSEPATVEMAGNFLRRSSRGTVAPILPILLQTDLDSMGGFLTLRSDSVQLRKGDSASFLPGGAFDRHYAIVGAASPYVPVVFGPRPSRVDFRLQPYMELPSPTLRNGDPFQVWVRARGEEVWVDCDSVPVADTLTPWVGATLTMNRVQEGRAYIYDNGGTFVASANLDRLIAMAAADRLPKDGSETFQLRFSWDGRSLKSSQVASGPYVMRLLLKDNDPENPKGLPVLTNRVYKLGIKRPTK